MYYAVTSTNATSICSECFRTPYVLYMQLQHQGNSPRNGAIKHIFADQIHGGIINELFLIHLSLHALLFI